MGLPKFDDQIPLSDAAGHKLDSQATKRNVLLETKAKWRPKVPRRSSSSVRIIIIKTPFAGLAWLTYITELQTQYSNYKNALQQLAQKIGDVEQEAEGAQVRTLFLFSSFPHAVGPVKGPSSLSICGLGTLTPLPKDRKCFRMINGVLVERTVEDVIPALNTNAEGLKQVLDELVKQYKTKQEDLEKWKKKNNVQVVQN
ncbi:hypothetical protein PG989_007990 [Apiospora arundinis]